MKRSLLCGFMFVLAVFAGCRSTSDSTLGPTASDVVAEGASTPQPRMRLGVDAQGHFQWQDVVLVSPDGSVSDASFRADYTVGSSGRASGTFAFFIGEELTVYRITSGEVTCVGGSDVITLHAVVVGADTRSSLAVDVDVIPTDNPECIIWDIKDSCQHEANGKHDVVQSACDR